MTSRIEVLAKIRSSGCYMQEKDLAELYTYLLLFSKTYLCARDEAVVLLDAIRMVYSLEFSCPDPEAALRKLKNPRNAGRKPHFSATIANEVKNLHEDGLSVRAISNQIGISKSSVQRLLRD